MKGHGSQFSRKKEAAIAALLTARTDEEAARICGLGVATLRRWKKDPEFAQAFREEQRHQHAQSLGRLAQLAHPAVAVMANLMMDPKVHPSSRLYAANSILNHGTRALQINDLEDRTSALERQAKGIPDAQRDIKKRYGS